MEPKKSKFARRYDREFKESAVELIQTGRTITEVARDLGQCGQDSQPAKDTGHRDRRSQARGADWLPDPSRLRATRSRV